MTASARALVLGSWSTLPPEQLRPFVHSLRASGFEGSFWLVLGHHDPADRKAFETLADRVIDVRGCYARPPRLRGALLARLRSTRGLRRFYDAAFRLVAGFGHASQRASLEFELEGLQTLRYGHYYRSIVDASPRPELVMLTDLRDVVFQRDPFADPVEGLELYLEELRIGDDPFNARWLRELYGDAALAELRGRPVSCSGTVLGTRNAVLAYLAEMVVELPRFRRAMGAHDQAVHNVLLQRGRLPSSNSIANGTGRVLTLGAMSEYRVDGDGRVLNEDGTVPAVLHQWDRHQELASQLEAAGLIRWES